MGFGPVEESPRHQKRVQLTDALHASGGLDYAGFMEASDQLRRSVVLRGLGRETRAVRLWTQEYLKQRLGEHTFTFVGGTPDPSRVPTDTRLDVERLTFARFLQVCGRKTWTCVEPRYTLEVFPIMARPALYAVSHYGGWRESSPDHVLFRIPEPS